MITPQRLTAHQWTARAIAGAELFEANAEAEQFISELKVPDGLQQRKLEVLLRLMRARALAQELGPES